MTNSHYSDGLIFDSPFSMIRCHKHNNVKDIHGYTMLDILRTCIDSVSLRISCHINRKLICTFRDASWKMQWIVLSGYDSIPTAFV